MAFRNFLKLPVLILAFTFICLSISLSACKTDTKTDINSDNASSETLSETNISTDNMSSDTFSETDINSDKEFIDYKTLPGYYVYISDSDKGYEDLPYFGVMDSMEESEEAREYFRANSRQCGDYIITDYEDGVCINEYTGGNANYNTEDEIYISYVDVLHIPETLDGKPVVKLGGYLFPQYVDEEVVFGAFGGCDIRTLNIPKTVRVITKDALRTSYAFGAEGSEYEFARIVNISVEDDNPYYSSKEGILYSKDFSKLLYADFEKPVYDFKVDDIQNYTYEVPDCVESFQPINGIPYDLFAIKLGKNVKQIDTFIERDEFRLIPNEVKVYGYKGTVAEEWAKQENVKFEALD